MAVSILQVEAVWLDDERSVIVDGLESYLIEK